ncbi:hypothetical protein B0H11DRAFT_2253743 [Mycena galericulata]|nr:hypothetical protein B0H11DRAFT_2253743 [Mycena galericulata]
MEFGNVNLNCAHPNFAVRRVSDFGGVSGKVSTNVPISPVCRSPLAKGCSDASCLAAAEPSAGSTDHHPCHCDLVTREQTQTPRVVVDNLFHPGSILERPRIAPMNKFLSLGCLSELPRTIRDVAIPAAHGSLEDMEHLSRLIHGDPKARDTFMPCLCVLYANLDPSAIPRDGGPPGIPGALAVFSLKCLRLLGTPLGTSVDFWPRIWGWTHFISSHPEQFPPEPTGMDICIDFLLFVNTLIFKEVHRADLIPKSRAHEMINRTPGVRTLLARAWAEMFRDKKKQPTRDNMSALSWILTLLDFTKDSAHLQEAIDGAGGSLNDFARFIVRYIDSIVPTSRVDLSADQYSLLDGIFHPVHGFYYSSQDAQDAMRRAGFVASLTRMMCAFARYSGPRIWAHDESLVSFTGDDDLMGAAVFLMLNMLKSPRHTEISRDAISEGLLRAIVSYGIRGAEVKRISEMVAMLSFETIHYAVVSRLERPLRDASDITAHPAFKKSPNFAAWNTFRDLAIKRIAVAKLWKSPDSLSRKACDNMDVWHPR